MPGTILWFQQDLRLADNPALRAAIERREPIVPVYILEEGEPPEERLGAASRWWLHQSLAALDASLRQRNSKLILLRGAAETIVPALVRETGATAVHWNRRYEPQAIARSTSINSALAARGIEAASHNAALLIEPWEALNQAGKPYQVYTPFKRRVLHDLAPAPPLPTPRTLQAPPSWSPCLPLESLGLLPRVPWHTGMERNWRPGEAGARDHLQSFLNAAIGAYGEARERPADAGTSRLSPHLHFGEIGPRQVWHALGPRWRGSPFLAELVWREFAYHLLYHFPRSVAEPLRPEFARFPWRSDPRALAAWQQGRTGIPLVDAGMRQLWSIGWMHNRVRMIVASFLVKNLLQPWQEGARWFWDTLVDADLANNTLGWQWVAGSGADAAPYFRIFNPVSQGQRFDPQGAYVRQWVPELARLADRFIHAPWTAPRKTLAAAGIELAHDYPEPIVDLAASRETALEAYEALRRSDPGPSKTVEDRRRPS